MRSLPPVREVRDLLALVRFELGFPPLRSVVIVPTAVASRAGGPLVRLDLDLLAAARHGDTAQRAAAGEVVEEVLGHVRRSGASEAVVLVIADSPVGDPGRSDHDQDDVALAAWVGRQVEESGVACTPLLLVHEGRWCSLDPADDGPADTPVWEAVGDVLLSPIAAAMIGEGGVVVEDRAHLLPRLPDTEPAHEHERCGCAAVRPASAWLAGWLRAVEAVERDPRAPAADPALACLVGALGDLPLRDAVLVSFVCPQPAAARAVLAAGSPTSAGRGRRQDWRDAFDRGLRGPVPQVRVQAGEALLERLLQALPWHSADEGLAVLAWVAWWTGRGARAQVFADEVLRRHPEHGLARLTSHMIEALVPPPWVDAA